MTFFKKYGDLLFKGYRRMLKGHFSDVGMPRLGDREASDRNGFGRIQNGQELLPEIHQLLPQIGGRRIQGAHDVLQLELLRIVHHLEK